MIIRPSRRLLRKAQYLPSALASHLPLDLVVLMLGTNDAKAFLNRSALDIAMGMNVLVGQVLTSAGGVGTAYPAPKVLLVAPPPLGDIPDPRFRVVFDGGHEKTARLAELYRGMANVLGLAFFDAGAVITNDGVDGIHLTEQNNRDLGEALAPLIRSLLA